MAKRFRFFGGLVVAGAFAMASALPGASAMAAGSYLTGNVKGPDGKPMEGVVVSARAVGTPVIDVGTQVSVAGSYTHHSRTQAMSPQSGAGPSWDSGPS